MPRQVKQSELANNPQDQVYQERPIQNYGMSLLQSMGFTEEKGIGKNKQNALADLLILKPRPRGLGLGAQQQKEPQKPKFTKGNYIMITEGVHKDLVGMVVEVKQSILFIQLIKSYSQVQVTSTSVKVIRQSEVSELHKKNKEQQPSKKKRLKWIVPGIKIKVVDKNSAFYLKKMVVTDLISERQFECIYQSESGSKIIKDLREKDVQTVVPKQGQTVLILKGTHQGQKGKIIQRQKKSQKVTVQTFNELELVTLSEDDISQYVEL